MAPQVIGIGCEESRHIDTQGGYSPEISRLEQSQNVKDISEDEHRGSTASPSAVATGARPYWPELSASSPYVRRTGWEHRPMPPELVKIPEDFTIPQILRQIHTWSLIPGSNWSFPSSNHTEEVTGSREEKRQSQGVRTSITKLEAESADSNIDNASNASYTTTLTHLGPKDQGQSQDIEKSLKVKLLSRIGFKSPAEVSLSSEPVSDVTKAECTSCFEDLPEVDMTRLKSCRHWYCKDCFCTLVVTAMATESSFPPKCCLSPVPLSQILRALNAKQREDYKTKAAEYAVPASARWYCPNTKCLKWIPAHRLRINRDQGYDCPHCSSKLCRTCRGPAHLKNAECPQDFGLEAILETAEVEGWQRCYKCRALVEHNKGCRHMTCRCGGQFCYVCGLRWQTCSCTETDAATKRAGAQRRRQERDARQDAEAAEIARAIAEIEDMERQAEEERRQEEQRRQQEEEEQLRALEVLRLQEEAQKKAEAEQAERELRAVLVKSFEDECTQIEKLCHNIAAIQSAAINHRHESTDSRLSKLGATEEENVKREFDTVDMILQKNSSKRRNRLAARQKCNQEALHIRQEEDEDDLFLQVQMRLKGKANRESRMERMLNEIHKQQEDDRNELQAQQKKELEELEKKINFEIEGLRRWYEATLRRAKDKQITELMKFGHTVGADRQYFEIVLERRLNMIAYHNDKCLRGIEAGKEPIALTEFEASKIEPFLPELDEGEQGPSGINRRVPTFIPTVPDHCHSQQGSAVRIQPARRIPDIRIDTRSPYRGAKVPQLPGPNPPLSPFQPFQEPMMPGSFPSEPVNFPPLLPARSELRAPPPPPPPPPPTLAVPISPPTPSYLVAGRTSPNPFKMNANPPREQGWKSQNASMAFPAIGMAGLAASMALGVGPPQTARRLQESNLKHVMSSITSIEPAVDASAGSLGLKRSRWAFRKPKHFTEDEIKQEMRMTVGDASY